ncbi:MAG: radical SAM protein [Acidobacteriota bacterium]|nr:radical SAM protein [Acidobacteriota bacterium]
MVPRMIPVYSIYRKSGHSPLALGMVAAAARHYQGGMLDEAFKFIEAPISSLDSALDLIREHGPGVLLCSDYVWTDRENLELTRRVKELYPEAITVHGGPSVPKYDYAWREYFASRPTVDVIVHGEGEITAPLLLERLAAHADPFDASRRLLSDIAGITYRDGDRPVHARDRERIVDLDALPSPYLDGWFSREHASTWIAAIVETNRGCPYGCTFCDWGSATLSKIRKFAMERVRAEIEWVARHRIGILWIADANFGIFDRDVAIAEWIGRCRRTFGYPRQVVVNYAKNATKRLAEIMRIFTTTDVRSDALISIQTHDEQTLRNIERSNIKLERYEELIGIFRSENLPISTDLIFALPGSTIETLMRDLQFFFDRRIYAKLHPAQVLVNSPMAHRDYMRKFAIEADADGFVTSTYSCTPDDIRTMWALREWYMLLVGFCVLKYFLYYVQLDGDIPAIQFIYDLHRAVGEDEETYPALSRLLHDWRNVEEDEPYERVLRRRSAQEWAAVYAEVKRFTRTRYGITDPALDDVLIVQARLMPSTDRALPERLDLSHDVVSYYAAVAAAGNLQDLKSPAWKRLSEHPPGALTVSDPSGLCDPAVEDLRTYDIRGLDWELASDLMTYKVPSHFIAESSRTAGGQS